MSKRARLAVLLLGAGVCVAAGCFFFPDNGNTTPTDLAGADLAGDLAGTPSGNKVLGLIEVAGARNASTASQFTSISIAFFQEPAGCTENTENGCTVKHCPASSNALVYRRAGQITITGGSRNYTLNPTESGAYAAIDQAGPPFIGGEKITLTAVGDLVPPFAIDAIAPFQILAEQPKVTGGVVNVSVSKPLAIAWSGSPGGDVLGVLTRYSNAGEVTTGYCRFSGESGTGQLPLALVQTIANAAGETITFGMISRNQTTKKVGAYDVQFNLTFAPGNTSSGSVTFVP